MAQEQALVFGSFHLDVPQGHLRRGDQTIALRPQSLVLLRYLVEHPGRLVTKAEVRQHVWRGTHVTDSVLWVSVHEIRRALDLLSAPLKIPLVYCHINRFRRASSCGEAMARRRKEDRRAGLASRGI
jgi:DNA-binding response OmpR family regulator